MTFVDAIKAGFKNFANFKGTARRSEFWYWVLFTTLVALVLDQVDRLSGLAADGTGMGLSSLASLALLIPNISIIFRRLHDAGFSGWLYALNAIPVAAGVWFITTFVTEYEASGLPTEGNAIGLALEEFAAEQTGPIYDAIMAGELDGSATSFLILLLTAIAVGVAFIIFYTRPTKTAQQGNKYAGSPVVEDLSDGGTTA